MNNGKLSIDPCYGFGTEWVVTFFIYFFKKKETSNQTKQLKQKIYKRKRAKQNKEKKKDKATVVAEQRTRHTATIGLPLTSLPQPVPVSLPFVHRQKNGLVPVSFPGCGVSNWQRGEWCEGRWRGGRNNAWSVGTTPSSYVPSG